MSYLVCIWAVSSVNTDNNYRLGLIEALCQDVAAEVTARQPRNVGWDAIVVMPEYFLSSVRVNHEAAKSVDEVTKDYLVTQLQLISQKYPTILLIPGTIAFRKSFIRPPNRMLDKQHAPKTVSRLHKVVQHLGTDTINQDQFGQYPYGNSPFVAIQGAQSQLAGIQQNILQFGEPAVEGYYSIFKNQSYVFLGGQVKFKYNKQMGYFEVAGALSEVFAPDVTRVNTTEIWGKKFSFEICLEHGSGAARTRNDTDQLMNVRIAQYFKEAVADIVPDIQVVVSDWVETAPPNIIVKRGGVYIHASSNEAQCTVELKTQGAMQKLGPLVTDVWNGYRRSLYMVDQ